MISLSEGGLLALGEELERRLTSNSYSNKDSPCYYTKRLPRPFLFESCYRLANFESAYKDQSENDESAQVQVRRVSGKVRTRPTSLVTPLVSNDAHLMQ